MSRTTLVAAALAATALAPASAGAITPAAPDGAGHPSVGIMVGEWRTPGVKDRICSGTLIAPRIFLTAAHCNVSGVPGIPLDEYYVSFDPVYVHGSATVHRGTFVPNPDADEEFMNAGPAGDPQDVAIVVLDEPAPVAPAQLPPAGLLDSLDLADEHFVAVGYGRTRIDKTRGPNNIVDQTTRNVITQSFRHLFRSWLTLNGDPGSGEDFTCYGDSGGPHFLGDSNVIVSITATGDIPCRALEVTYRLDTPAPRRYLAAQGVTLP